MIEKNTVQASETAQQRKQSFFTKLLDALSIPAKEDGIHGTFAASEVIKSPPEGSFLYSFHVEGIGKLHLPLSAEDTHKLRGVCDQAPFGRGLATIVDTSVRRCWQMDASKVSFPGAPDFISKTVQQLAIEAVGALGIDSTGMQLEAHLYKLLLYMRNGQVKVHKDTEKEKGMFGTMIIQLPTEVGFEGGELIVNHKGSTKTFDGSQDSSSLFRYTVFFADCEHELLKVTNGTRLCLAFNLVRQGSVLANQGFPRKEIIGLVEKVEVILEPWLEETMTGKLEEFGGKVAIPLQHEYTEENLSFTGLKGDDSIVAEVLKCCRDKNGEQWLDLHLCLVTKHQNMEPDFYYEPFDYRRNPYRDYDEEDDEDEDEESDGPDDESDHADCNNVKGVTKVREVYSEDIEVNNWIGMDNERAVAFEKLDIDMEKEVAVGEGEQPFHDDPDNEEYEGNLGNEGPSLQHWYHRAMLVVWPKKRSASIACGAGIFGALAILDRMLENDDPQFCESLHDVICYCENDALQVWNRSGEDQVTSRLLNLCIRAGGSEHVLRVLNLMSKTFGSQHSRPWKFGNRCVGLGSLVSNTLPHVVQRRIPWKVGIRNVGVANGIAAAVQMLGWKACSPNIVDLVEDCILSQGEAFAQLAMQLFQMGNRDAAVIVAKKPCEVFSARIDELSGLKRPEFSWCQPSARLPHYPNVQAFLRGPQESMRFNDVKSLPDARKFANSNFNGLLKNGYSAIGIEDGRGASAYCDIRKTRHAFEVSMRDWEKGQEELKNLRLQLEKFKAIGIQTDIASVSMAPDVAGHRGKKRKKMDAEAIDIYRLKNTRKSCKENCHTNVIDLSSDEN